MKALLLAAGFGTRLRPLTDSIPKCLVPIHGKPLLAYWLDLLLPNGISRAIINTHYMAAQVEKFSAQSRWRDQITLVYEPELLGTGGTILANRQHFTDGAFLVAHADNLARFDVKAFIARHQTRPSAAAITMMTFDTDTPQTCGIVEENAAGLVTAFHEKKPKPPGRRANAAVYIFEPEVVETLAALGLERPDISLDLIPRFMGRIATWHNADYLRDIGTPESLAMAERSYA